MRKAFAEEIRLMAKDDTRIVLLSGDIGNRMFEGFKEVDKGRFFNCGVAEANMISMATGMAISGLRPFIYTITPFATARCFEQIKIGLGYHCVPVVIIGTGSGLSYSELGPTHHSLDDIGIIRTIPGINIYVPSDASEVGNSIKMCLDSSSPSYIRIGKKGEPSLSGQRILRYSASSILRKGDDLLIITAGPIISEVLKAVDNLNGAKSSLEVVDIGIVKPLPASLLFELRSRHKKWLIVEEHSIHCGLGSSLLEWNALNPSDNIVDIYLHGTPDEFINKLGNQQYVRTNLDLDSHGISKKIIEVLGR